MVVSLLAALSVAAERLVEILKGLVPFLNQENPDARKTGEEPRSRYLRLLPGLLQRS